MKTPRVFCRIQAKTESISANFLAKPTKNYVLNHLPRHDRMGKTTISHYCPFKNALILGKNDVKCALKERSGRGHEES